ncbi:hypothetical protein C8R44DRAFT_668218 [Mycena epipterygia]|nr:hypothetical protein C8R44DRAFT_668218 [Mycena epipterygia]
MVRGKRLPSGPSTLARLVAHLKAPPKLTLPYLSSLRLTLAARNDHFGARHFLKEQLPRIRYANPNLDIHVRKMTKRPTDHWRPELELSFHDGKSQTLNLHGNWSTAIVRKLMDSAGSPTWARWKAEAARSGLPLIPGAAPEPALDKVLAEQTPEPLLSLDEWRAQNPRRSRRRRAESPVRGPAKTGKAVKGAAQAKRKEQKVATPALVVQAERVPAKAVVPERTKEEEEQRRAAKKEARRARLDAPRLAEEEAERRVALELLAKPRTGAAAVLP